MKCRKKPIILEAIQYTDNNLLEVMKFCGEGKTLFDFHLYVVTSKLSRSIRVHKGDYIIKDEYGECYLCDSNTFRKTYEVIE